MVGQHRYDSENTSRVKATEESGDGGCSRKEDKRQNHTPGELHGPDGVEIGLNVATGSNQRLAKPRLGELFQPANGDHRDPHEAEIVRGEKSRQNSEPCEGRNAGQGASEQKPSSATHDAIFEMSVAEEHPLEGTLD